MKKNIKLIVGITVAALTGVGMSAGYVNYIENRALPEEFTVTAHTGCEGTKDNSLDAITVGFGYGADIVEIDLGYYEIEIKGEKAYAISKKPKYPETYEECCKLLGLEESVVDGCIGYDYKAFGALQKLILCRDAYWKVDEWTPDWTIYCEDTRKYTIERNQDKLSRSVSYVENCIFAFPTEESRDKFFENFRDLIEKCKHLI
jgi:hypothetical protein